MAVRQHVGPILVEPSFIEGASGRLFSVLHRPGEGAPALRGVVLCLQGFNEELNRCRSMVTLQAQAFAGQGLATLVLDLFGTGDSEGEHDDARWELWQADVKRALQHLQGKLQVPVVALWGIRLAAILAAQMKSELPDAQLLLWQPVLDGKMHLTQFLRVRMAAQLDRPDLPKETTQSMRAQLAQGESVEVGGYALHPQFTRALDGLKLANHPPAPGARVLLLEQASADKPELSLPNQGLLSAWQQAGVRIEGQAFVGPAFWQVHERALAPDLIEKSTAWLSGAAHEVGLA